MAGRLPFFALLRIVGGSIGVPMMGRSRGFFAFAFFLLPLRLRWHPRIAFAFAGIRELLARFSRRP
ncbi:hypothetical protein, partial [Paraburkholderia caribensis]|uniref:hypothetical protein n=1 Tax=Paraburkholderia caribensis TaxID=75105 RepID=UPI003F4969A0